jgi:hypothetical protein
MGQIVYCVVGWGSMQGIEIGFSGYEVHFVAVCP